MSAVALLAAVMAAAHAQHSVHYTSTTVSPAATVSFVADVGGSEGIQRITFRHQNQTGHVTIIVAHRTAYFRGDASSLRWYLAFPADLAARFANTWIRIPAGARQFRLVAEGATFPSELAALEPQGTLKRVLAGVNGTTPTRAVTLSFDGRRLPTHEAGVNGGADFGISFSRWNEAVSVDPPTSSVPVREVTHAAPGA